MNTIKVRELMERGRSADFPGPMAGFIHAAQEEWETGARYGHRSHPGEVRFGGPAPYIEYLEGVMREAGGWVGGPAWVSTIGEAPFVHPFVCDGHHRIVAAYMIGLDEIPFR